MLERACVRVPGSVGVCMRIRACSLANPTRNAYAPYCDVICRRTPPHFSTLSHKRYDFRKKVIEHRMCVFIFSTTFIYNISRSKKNLAKRLHVKYPLFLSDFNEI